jgi:hypothetical protein
MTDSMNVAYNSGKVTTTQGHNPADDMPVIHPQIAALPTASAAYKGHSVLVPGNGTTTADTFYICLMSATGTYSWKQIVTG